MTLDKTVLKAILRLSRRREAAEQDALVLRAGAPAAAVRSSLRRLEAQGLVEPRPGRAPRLTLQGLAVAVALLPVVAARSTPRARRTHRAA